MAKKDTNYLAPKQGKVTRKGRHSKNKSSKLKTSKNYLKRYRGQG